MDWVEKEQDRKRRNNIDEEMDRLKNKTDEQYSQKRKEINTPITIKDVAQKKIRDRCRERGGEERESE